MKIIILDDVDVFRSSLKSKILAWAENGNCTGAIRFMEFSSSEDLLQAYESGLSPDAYFIDIEIPNEISGLDLAKHIYKNDRRTPIIFISSHIKYAVDGYGVRALGFITKPITQPDVDRCMDIIKSTWEMKRDFISLSFGGIAVKADCDKIMYFESLNRKTRLVMSTGGLIETSDNLKDIMRRLREMPFIQCHRSYIVNTTYIVSIKGNEILLTNEVRLPVGRKYRDLVFKAIERSVFND